MPKIHSEVHWAKAGTKAGLLFFLGPQDSVSWPFSTPSYRSPTFLDLQDHFSVFKTSDIGSCPHTTLTGPFCFPVFCKGLCDRAGGPGQGCSFLCVQGPRFDLQHQERTLLWSSEVHLTNPGWCHFETSWWTSLSPSTILILFKRVSLENQSVFSRFFYLTLNRV